jgi:hypothetical protein
MLSEDMIIAPAIVPNANINATITSAYINTKAGSFVNFILTQKTAGTNTGRSTITVQAASDTSGTGAAPVPFRYRKKTTGIGSDQWGPVVEVAAAGFGTVANEDTLYEIEVDVAGFIAAGVSAKPFVALRLTQLVADTVLGSAIAVVKKTRYAGQTIGTVMA